MEYKTVKIHVILKPKESYFKIKTANVWEAEVTEHVESRVCRTSLGHGGQVNPVSGGGPDSLS